MNTHSIRSEYVFKTLLHVFNRCTDPSRLEALMQQFWNKHIFWPLSDTAPVAPDELSGKIRTGPTSCFNGDSLIPAKRVICPDIKARRTTVVCSLLYPIRYYDRAVKLITMSISSSIKSAAMAIALQNFRLQYRCDGLERVGWWSACEKALFPSNATTATGAGTLAATTHRAQISARSNFAILYTFSILIA
ncbi:hypothetical protein CC80DRAFT_83672 [Byssothecium circinans]|uniref:Uncharacterized protein n=1 Tax=Byssothecium circinans TaxID=147558 RepID=A0A6A5TU99_9PLEO|nr:hypothetical protein CC80DRAFT_83672 [Byssothecium circinans]